MLSSNDHHTIILVKKFLDLAQTGVHDEIRTIVTVLPIVLVAYFIGVCIYRVTFHPLARYPGPFLRKISAWPEALSAASGKKHIDEYRLHTIYGDIVRTSPDTLSFNTAEAFRQLHADRNVNVIKSRNMAFNRDTIPTQSMIVMDNKQEHASRRRLVAHAFSEKALAESESLMIEKIDDWTNSLGPSSADKQNGWSTPKNMSDWCNLLALDVISKLCFGQDYGAIKAGQTPVHPTLIENAKFVQKWSYSPLLPFIMPLLKNAQLMKLLTPSMYERRWAFRLLTRSMLEKRNQAEVEADESGEETQHDFFHYIFRAKDSVTGERLPFEKYDSEAALLVAAGSDTTSTALSSLLFYLNYNPEVKAKLEAEIRSTFDDVDEIRTGPQLNSLHYLRACIDEALRMNPPVPSGLAREVLHNGMSLDGQFVPEGTVVNVALYGLHRDGRHFPEPHKFIPERWIEGSQTSSFTVTEETLKQARSAFNPFSAGMRNCAGKNMAYQEMSIAMARLIFQYDMRFSTAPGAITGGGAAANSPGLETESEFCYEDFFITTKKGPYLEYKKRETTY